MEIDMEQKLEDIEGNVLEENGKHITLKSICINAALGHTESERLSGEQKLNLYELAIKIRKGGVIDLTAEEIVTLKDRIGKLYYALVVGQGFDMLEGKEQKEEEEYGEDGKR